MGFVEFTVTKRWLLEDQWQGYVVFLCSCSLSLHDFSSSWSGGRILIIKEFGI